MDDFVIARAAHVLSVLFWIGGVAFVTTTLLPSIARMHPPGERLARFHEVESGFARQARWSVLAAGASGAWMVYRAEMWDRFLDPHFWWMNAMLGLWLVFVAMLFVIEPLFLHAHMVRPDPTGAAFRRVERLHRVLLALALVTTFGAVAGSHGLF